VLYPLWRPARKKLQVNFGGYNWLVLEIRDESMLLLSENAVELGKYHDVFEDTTWADSAVRKYLNNSFYNSFNPDEQARILETKVFNHNNPWFGTSGGESTVDKIFLLSIEEALRYFGDSGQLRNPAKKFFIDDNLNGARKAMYIGDKPTRWFLRTPGSSPDFVSVVTIEGKISVTGDFVNRSSTDLFDVGIRPAMRVKKESGMPS